MRLLFVVQRYGREVAGGAELCCRQFATHLTTRGHRVDVATSRARSYVDWHDEYPGGATVVDGVTVHRFSVRRPRQHRYFKPLNTRAIWKGRPRAPVLQEAWIRAQGPELPALGPWLDARATDYDVVVFFTYLYATTWIGLTRLAGRVPTVLAPTAHDEPPLWLPLFDPVLVAPTLYAYLTEEERELIARRTHRPRSGAVIGIGTDLDQTGEPGRFRRKFDLNGRPYLLYVGRVDSAKGSVELYEQFVAYKQRQRRGADDLALVVVGDPIAPLAPHPDVIMTGYVDDQTKTDGMAGALALSQPSYFESFSMVLTEAWAQRRPALVQGHCDVVVGQTSRSGGGLAYHDFAEFEAAVDLLLERPGLVRTLGENGRHYVEERYAWPTVMARYEELMRSAAATYRGAATGQHTWRPQPSGQEVTSHHARPASPSA